MFIKHVRKITSNIHVSMYILLTLCKVVVIALNTGILRSVSTVCDRSRVTARYVYFH